MDISKFILSEKQYLKINCEDLSDVPYDGCGCSELNIYYIDEEKNISIEFGHTEASTFCYLIAKSGFIQNKLDGKSTKKNPNDDLGFAYNQYSQGLAPFPDDADYSFMNNSHNINPPFYDSWMYNDKDGNIIFEITPAYEWHYRPERERDRYFIAYDDFMKDYKPVIQIVVPKENLEKWIDQAKQLGKMLSVNLD